ncbi:hypothetical protein RND81_03G067700 [Saponaria officinalis]|uniref:Retrotransposon gag domain-containing protein n=1 Tax=Saponaria officinalis TaxID=3572 RepID=A0AAW1M8B1_SAPOF
MGAGVGYGNPYPYGPNPNYPGYQRPNPRGAAPYNPAPCQDPLQGVAYQVPPAPWMAQVENMIENMVGSSARRESIGMGSKPYPDWIDHNNPYPHGFRIPDFTLFSGDDNVSAVEHLIRFTNQCREAADNGYLKLRLFPSSLTGTTFSWYINLQNNSILDWKRFDGSVFRDFIELTECVIKYEQVLLEEIQQKHQAFHTVDIIDEMDNSCEDEVAQRLFDHILELRMLIFPKVEGIDMKGVCRWHMNEMHSTEQCQTFQAFVAKQIHRHRLILTGEEARVMRLQTTEDVASAISGKVQEGESSKSYKEALKGKPQYPRLVQSMKYLRKGMCFGCADLLHFELIRMQAIPNDPSWVLAHQRRFTRFTKRGREMELAGVSRGPRGSQGSGSMKQPLEPTSAKVVNQSKTQQKKIAKQVAMAARSRFDQKLQQEAMIADMRVKEQEHQDKGKELAKENQAPEPCNDGPPKTPGPDPGSEGRPESANNKELNELRSAGKDRELTDAEKDVLVRALFMRRGVDNQHSKALYLKVRLENKTVSKVLVDNGATSNIVPITILQLIGKTEDDITPGKVTVVGFAGTPEFCEGTIMLTVKVGSCTLTMPFYVVRGITSYNALLGRSWLHGTYSIPSSLHQLLVMRNGRRYEIIYADMPSVEINFSFVHNRCSKGSATLRIEERIVPRGGDANKESESLLEDPKIEELIEVEDLEVEESTPRKREDAVELSLLHFRC